MNQHLSSTVFDIVSNNSPFSKIFLVAVEHLEHLGCLGTWGGTHIQDQIGGFDVKEQGRHHRYEFLAGCQTSICRFFNKIMQPIQHFALFKLLLCCIDLVDQWVPRYPLNFYWFLGLKLSFKFIIGNHVSVFQFIDKASIVGLVGIYSEHNRQTLLHAGPEHLKLFLVWEVWFELQHVILTEICVLRHLLVISPDFLFVRLFCWSIFWSSPAHC